MKKTAVATMALLLMGAAVSAAALAAPSPPVRWRRSGYYSGRYWRPYGYGTVVIGYPAGYYGYPLVYPAGYYKYLYYGYGPAVRVSVRL